MTIEQKQHLLAFLGYYNDSIDGIWGAASSQATKDFQADYGIIVDGIFGPETEKRIRAVISSDEQPADFWDAIQYFRKEEFACKCGGKHCGGFPAEPKQALVQTADRVRAHFGAPALVSSGVRCKQHNEAVGGVADSRHLSGKAMDFCVSGKSAQQVLGYVQSQQEVRYAYAIDANYVHMDVQ